MPSRVKKLPLTAAPKVRMRNRSQIQQRKCNPRRVQSIAEDERERNRQQPDNFSKRQRVLAEYLQHIRQQRHAGTEQNEPDNVERLGIFFAIIRQMQIDQNEAGDADWKIHKEY